MSTFSTADLCDLNPEGLQICGPELKSFGGRPKCAGQIVTARIDEDNRSVIDLLHKPGEGKVLVIDVSAKYCAVVGDRLATYAKDNDWSGFVINGYVRDQARMKDIDVGVWALGACPHRSLKRAPGVFSIEVRFAGVNFLPNDYLYADIDGIITCPKDLLATVCV